MRNCENCGQEIAEDAISCNYCGQKVSIKSHAADKTHISEQDVPAKSLPGAENNFLGATLIPGEENHITMDYRDVEENQTLPSFPAPPTPPNSSAKNRNPVILALLIVTAISALVLGGVLTVYSYWHPASTVTPTPVSRVTPTSVPQITITPVRHTTPRPSPRATSPVVQVTPRPSPQPTLVPMVNVSPTTFGQTSCPQNSDASWTCTATVTETAGLQSVNWSVTDSSFSDVIFTPLKGSISVDNPNKVSITIPATDCQNSTFTFKFTGGVNSIAELWNCIPGSGGVNKCSFSYAAGQGWTCTTTVFSNSDNLSNVPWSTNSTGVSGISFTPQNGVLPPNLTNPVTIFIPDTICPTNATLTFSIGISDSIVSWSCPTPTLSVTPTSFYTVDDCPFDSASASYTCTVKLSSDSSNQGELNWSVSSPVSTITFSQPTSDTLLPSGSTMVNITVPLTSCPTNPTLTSSVSGSNPIDVSWTCSG